jgi:hypothetical protein
MSAYKLAILQEMASCSMAWGRDDACGYAGKAQAGRRLSSLTFPVSLRQGREGRE